MLAVISFLAAGAVTFGLRWSFLATDRAVQLSPTVRAALGLVGPAALAALATSGVVGHATYGRSLAPLLVLAVTVVVGARRNVAEAIAAGIAAALILEAGGVL